MRADKQLFERGALSGRVQPETFADVRAVFVIISNFQPLAFIICSGLQRHSRAAQHQRVFELQRRFQHVIGIDQNSVTLTAASRGDIIFSVALRAVFEAEAEIALFAMAFVVLKPALAAATKMLNKRAFGGHFPPKSVGKTAGRAKNLYRNVAAFAFWRAHFRRIQVVRITGVIENQTVGFAGCQP
ncbi:hypothetical protein D3C80_1079340 [compost metagenome]